MKQFKITLTLLTLLALIGCASTGTKTPSAQQEAVYQKSQAALKQVNYWELDGRFALRHQNQSGSASIRWLNNNNSYAIKIAGPMSQGTMVIASNGEYVVLTDQKGNKNTAPTPEALLNQYTQMDMPVSNLQYWLVGKPVPNTPAETQLNSKGLLKELKQQDWTVRYTQYTKVGKLYMPKKMIIENPDVKMTFSIQKWNVSPKPYV